MITRHQATKILRWHRCNGCRKDLRRICSGKGHLSTFGFRTNGIETSSAAASLSCPKEPDDWPSWPGSLYCVRFASFALEWQKRFAILMRWVSPISGYDPRSFERERHSKLLIDGQLWHIAASMVLKSMRWSKYRTSLWPLVGQDVLMASFRKQHDLTRLSGRVDNEDPHLREGRLMRWFVYWLFLLQLKRGIPAGSATKVPSDRHNLLSGWLSVTSHLCQWSPDALVQTLHSVAEIEQRRLVHAF